MKERDIVKLAHKNNIEREIFCKENKIKQHHLRIKHLKEHLKLVETSEDW